jgi:hypothetical protein
LLGLALQLSDPLPEALRGGRERERVLETAFADCDAGQFLQDSGDPSGVPQSREDPERPFEEEDVRFSVEIRTALWAIIYPSGDSSGRLGLLEVGFEGGE